jgi:hypothetical protein
MEHKNKNMSRWLALPFVLLAMAALFLPATAFADLATAVTVVPASQNVGTGATFAVNISVVPDTAIAGMQFNLSFNASLIQVNNVTEGNLFKQGGANTSFQILGGIDNTAGTITSVVCAILGAGSVSQNGTFATISFTAKTTAGTSALHLSNVIVGNPQGQAVSKTVTDGNVTVTGAEAEYTITFVTDPTTTGNITFAGVSYTNGGSVSKSAGTYNIVAGPGSGYNFASWQTTGLVSVTSATLATTTCNVTGAGTLKMVQTAAPTYTITFATDPTTTGNITFAGVSYSDGNTVGKTAATYAIVAVPGTGYYFDKWETTGSVSVTSSSSATTTCVVSGAGMLRMVQTTVPPVGGTAYPPNKLLMVLPWIAVGAAIIVATSVLLRRRRGATR